MVESFANEKFKQVFRSYYLKRCILYTVLWGIFMVLVIYRGYDHVESSVNIDRMMAAGEIAIAGFIATGAIAIGGGIAGGIIAIGGVGAIGVIAIGGVFAWGIVAFSGSNSLGIIAISGLYSYGVIACGGFIAIGLYVCGVYTLSPSGRGKSKYELSTNYQHPQAIKVFTSVMPKLKLAFSLR